MGIHPSWSARELDRRAAAEPRDDKYVTRPGKPDLYSDPGIQAAIKQREAAIVAEVQAKNRAAVVEQHRAKPRIDATAIERRIFNQVASVGGIRHGR
jgi:hypothetical protein